MCKLFKQILLVVEELHRRNIVHRDLKLKNILVKNGHITIIDFGIAYDYNVDRLTLDHERVGSFYYMAPENAEGKNITPNDKMDFYSLGKILYFLLSHGKIFDREKFRNSEYNLSNLFDDSRFEFVNEYFEKTINENPSERYEIINELIEGLKIVREKFWEKRSNYFDFSTMDEVYLALEYQEIEEGNKETIAIAKRATEKLGEILKQRNLIYFQNSPSPNYAGYTSPVYLTEDNLNEKYGQLVPYYMVDDECDIVVILYFWNLYNEDLEYIERNSEFRVYAIQFNDFESSGYQNKQEFQKDFSMTYDFALEKRETNRSHSLDKWFKQL